MHKLSLIIATLLLSTVAFAQNVKQDKTTGTPAPAPVTLDDMRCGKHMGKSLAEFTEELVENCDLNKPFSTSLSRLINEETYLYCCHKKK